MRNKVFPDCCSQFTTKFRNTSGFSQLSRREEKKKRSERNITKQKVGHMNHVSLHLEKHLLPWQNLVDAALSEPYSLLKILTSRVRRSQ